LGCEMKIVSTIMRIGEEQREQETILPANDEGKETIEKWVKWFREELLDALKKGDDVEILIGRKPNNNKYVR